ncbi:invasion associated locus B family protein [Cypionkella psychrotolerans]|uniref:hypothetical protein n=1 Tax=Cypionkella psychrotolerans TaxID=1678131 RepID=UPI000AE8BDD2|nr:hypothetical protein [Cypionkella psychrotolerans]
MAALIMSFFAAAQPASADAWKNMYLADTGGSHLIGVEPSESQQTDAYVDQSGGDAFLGTGGGLMLGMSCDRIRLANGDPFLGSEIAFVATFDGGEPVALGQFGYAGGAYLAPYNIELVEKFRNHASLTISAPSKNLSFEFSLQGFVEAFDQIECFKR